MNLIGEKLDVAIKQLEGMGFKCQVIDNNFSVDGDTKLVTNLKIEDKVAYITTGNFIFDIKNKQS